jgi:phosphoribosyl-AMP cyclohydrolase
MSIENKANNWLDEIQWSDDGLVPAIAQDYQNGEILMMAWMNREALALTVSEQRAIYWSRSRQKLWRKGEESGHVQQLHDLRLDCDSDVVLLKVKQLGGIACHTGRRHCFYKQLDSSSPSKPQWKAVDPVVKDPNDIYQKPK